MTVASFPRLGATLCICAGLLSGCGKTGPTEGKETGPAIPVSLVDVAERPMERVVSATGTFAPQNASTLSAKVPGRVQELAVDLGSVVRKGELLARIEPRDYELGLRQATAALAQARTTLGLPPAGEDDRIELEKVSSVQQAKAVLDEATKSRERVRSLSESGIAPAAELDTAEAAFLVARTKYEVALEDARGRFGTLGERRAELELAAKKLADASMYAPFDGTVQAREANLGEFLTAGTPVVRLVQTDPLRLRLQVPERESSLVHTGQVIRIHIESDTNTYTGRLSRTSPALDEETRMLLVEADVPANTRLRLGLFARAEIVVSQEEPGLTIPADCLTTFAGIEKVVLVKDGKAVERNVTTGRRGPGWVEIVAGVKVGEKVVRNPTGLRTGQRVTVRDFDPGATQGQKQVPPVASSGR